MGHRMALLDVREGENTEQSSITALIRACLLSFGLVYCDPLTQFDVLK